MKTLIILSVLILIGFFVSDLINTIPNKASDLLVEMNQTKPIKNNNIDLFKSSLKDSINSIIPPKVTKNENSLNLSSLFQKLTKQSQEFSISTNNDTILKCKEGIVLKISSNSFAFEDNDNQISKNIDLKIKEFYKLSDFIAANLTTTTKDDILETGGTIYIEAFSEGKKCKLKKDQTIEIRFPYKDKKEDMELFTGQFNESNIIEWTKQEIEKTENDNIYEFWTVDQKPEFIGGKEALIRYLATNTVYPAIAKERGVQGKVFIQFKIDTNGVVRNPKVLRGVDPSLDKEALRVIQSLPKFIPGKKNGKKVIVDYIIPINFKLNNGSLTKFNILDDDSIFKTEFNNNNEKSSINDVSNYILYSTNLGWINCDRFGRSPKQKINYFVNSDENVNVKIVFNEFRSILPGYYNGKGTVFQNVPNGEKITIIALKCENNSPYIAIKQTIISNKPENDLVFEKVSLEVLKAKIKILNNI